MDEFLFRKGSLPRAGSLPPSLWHRERHDPTRRDSGDGSGSICRPHPAVSSPLSRLRNLFRSLRSLFFSCSFSVFSPWRYALTAHADSAQNHHVFQSLGSSSHLLNCTFFLSGYVRFLPTFGATFLVKFRWPDITCASPHVNNWELISKVVLLLKRFGDSKWVLWGSYIWSRIFGEGCGAEIRSRAHVDSAQIIMSADHVAHRLVA